MLKHLLSLILLTVLVTTPVFAKENENHIRVCPRSNSQESADCHARVIVDQNGSPKTTVTPTGYGPQNFRGAYALGSGVVTTPTTIAIVDAYNDPSIFSDLTVYRSAFGITTPLNRCPVSAGTPDSPCFQKVNQNGQASSLPPTNAGWALEISLDVETAHAICPTCNLLLVEANSNSFTNLMTAIDRAKTMGAKVISNSYGGSESSGETTYDKHLNLPGVAVVFSSGDNGYGVEYPAASQFVTAVGGTTLNLSGNNWLGETAWGGAGSGCSLYEPKPSWQTNSDCSKRIVADISADADPNTGAAVYDSITYKGQKGWFKVGGTSLAAPLIAGVYALGGVPLDPTKQLYQNYSATNFHDITIGSNGSCGGSYLCTAISGYDGPTGLGSPFGLGAF